LSARKHIHYHITKCKSALGIKKKTVYSIKCSTNPSKWVPYILTLKNIFTLVGTSNVWSAPVMGCTLEHLLTLGLVAGELGYY